VHNLEGALENEIELPGLGSASGFGGNMDDTSLFYTFTSFTYPTSIFRYEVAARKSSLFRAPRFPGPRHQAVRNQAGLSSRARTARRCRCSWCTRKGLVLDGNNPTLMYGYGGFNIATTPASTRCACAARAGFVYASVNMRGGSEYGEAWHDAGTKLKKQNVFDDFIAGAEWLIANKYTNPSKLRARVARTAGC
jgi:prolyl oligopeptidase